MPVITASEAQIAVTTVRTFITSFRRLLITDR